MISFVMLTWNRKLFVEKMFSSFYENKSADCEYEFLIIDNGSNDGTVDYLSNTAKLDKNIKVRYNKKNKGLNEYKKLFNLSKGDYILIIDDDVIEFPKNFDKTMVEYMDKFEDFGFVCLDVVQNEYTDGAKPDSSHYEDITRNGLTISKGPTGGWCTIFRKKDYRKIKWHFVLGKKLKFGYAEDGKLQRKFDRILHLKSGVIKDVKCFHACGPYYSQKYGFLDRDIEKYKMSGLDRMINKYQEYK